MDMDLSPRWVQYLEGNGHEARHWSSVGAPDSPDTEITRYDSANDLIVLTHDLDFGRILAATRAVARRVWCRFAPRASPPRRLARRFPQHFSRCSLNFWPGRYLSKQLSVGAGAHEDNQAGFPTVIHFVGQQEISSDVALTVPLPIAMQRVIKLLGTQGRLLRDEQHHSLFEPAHIEATCMR